MYPAIHISPSKFCSFFKNWIIYSYFKIAVYYSILARLSSWWFSWLCASHAIYNIRIYNTRTRTQPSSVCPDFRRSCLMVIFTEVSWNKRCFCLLLIQRSVDQADADMYRELYQRNQSLQKQLLEAKEVSWRGFLAIRTQHQKSVKRSFKGLAHALKVNFHS